ncbi:hypothetical protein ACFLX9_02770 [Chloroflexota bacterium]
MNEYGVWKLPIEAIREIDKRRGSISRSDFAWCLLHAYDQGRSEVRMGVTQEEFKAFQQEIKSLLHTFLDFALSLGIELNTRGKREPSRCVEELHPNVSANGAAGTHNNGSNGDKPARR